jgi:hypothetical protein
MSDAEFQRLWDLGYFANTNAGQRMRNKGKVVIDLSQNEPKKMVARKKNVAFVDLTGDNIERQPPTRRQRIEEETRTTGDIIEQQNPTRMQRTAGEIRTIAQYMRAAQGGTPDPIHRNSGYGPHRLPKHRLSKATKNVGLQAQTEAELKEEAVELLACMTEEGRQVRSNPGDLFPRTL